MAIRYKHLGEIFVELAGMLLPPERTTVSDAAEKYVYLNKAGGYVGPYLNSTTPYMVEPMNTFTSPTQNGMVFVGPAQCGKALDVTTPIATADGWTTMGALRVGDRVFNEQGVLCPITLVTPWMHDHACYDVHFDDGTSIRADAEHRWTVLDAARGRERTLTTQRMLDIGTARFSIADPVLPAMAPASIRQTGSRRIVAIEPCESVPVCCISVDTPSHLYLAGRQMVPTHNTESLLLNTLAYTIKVEPMDMIIVSPTMTDARDFGMRRIDRLHENSKAIGEMLLPGENNDNTFDKHYRNGMLLTLSYPTRSQAAGKPVGRILITDRDRMDDDIEGDGEVFDLFGKRTTTFGRFAMCAAESSPSRPVENLKWVSSTPHEAPPCKGILGLYNRGDRRRWYWPCPHCGGYFEGMFDYLVYDREAGRTNREIAESVYMMCPLKGCKIHPDERSEMQNWGIWLRDGQGIDSRGRVYGPAPRTRIASFWLRGVAAAFTSWRTLVELYLDALSDYERTGGEEGLQKFFNNDLGEPYLPKSTQNMRLPEAIKSRAEDLPRQQVPEGVRFLVATVDVQQSSFVVQVKGILPGRPFDTVVVDRFFIRKSKRLDQDGERLWVKPATYLEDWHLLEEEVIDREYQLGDGSGRMMAIKQVGCDSGGKEGVTTMAYNFYRWLRDKNKHRRFMLVKGDGKPAAPRTIITYPDNNQTKAKTLIRGDIPVLRFNSNLLKDDLNGRLDCITPGKGMYRTPGWLADDFYAELCAEVRTTKGWENPAKLRNEAWDLSYYCIGLCVSELLRVEHIDWTNPPGWCAEWDHNDLVRAPEAESRFTAHQKSGYDFKAFAKALA